MAAAEAAGNANEALEKGMEGVLRPYLERAKPLFEKAKAVINVVEPYAEKAYNQGCILWKKAEPYGPKQMIPALIGFIWCFYGGAFVTAITAIEAFKAVAYERVWNDLGLLWNQFQVAHAAVLKDDPKADAKLKGGIPEDAVHKVGVALKACDPSLVNDALAGLYAGIMSVVAALRIRFAQTITFGNNFAIRLESWLTNKWVISQLELAVPKGYHKWIPTIIKYFSKFVGISSAWMVQRVVFAAHTSVTGGMMLANGIVYYLETRGVKKPSFDGFDSTKTYIGGALAAFGFYTQFVRGFASTGILGFLLFPLFLPLQIFEFVLELCIGRAY
jgi:hypothetical protein